MAVAAAPHVTPLVSSHFKVPAVQNWLVLVAIFIVAGIVLSAILRMGVSEMVGPDVSIPDRAAGAMLGALRVALLAVLLVVIFDRIIPPGREPNFLKGSQWRPILSSAGQHGLRSLPPEVEDYIDKLKRQRGI